MTKPDASEHVPGEILDGKYQIVRLLGSGGMGVVYAAKRLALGDVVAIKCILSSQNTEANRARFIREARAVARIRHPNVVQVFDFGEPPRRSPYIVMELLDGPTLGRVLRDGGKLPVERALSVFAAICAAVEAGHRRGVIHRDLKPSNVMLARSDDGRERVKVLDFGLARVAATPGSLQLTNPGSLLGTCSYMAPEQIEGTGAGPAVDVFALGVLLYQMVTGKLPFAAQSHLATMVRIAEGKFDPPTEHEPDLPEPLVAGIEAALSRDPGDRPSSPEALAQLVGAQIAPIVTDHSTEIRLDDDAVEMSRSSMATEDATLAGAGGPLDGDDDTLVGAAEPSIPSLGPNEQAFVGREEELEQLMREYAATLAGRGRVTVITGDAGAGKTRLLDELMRRVQAEGASVLRGRFFAYEGDRPPPYETFLWMLSEGSSAADHELAHEARPGGAGIDPGKDKWQAFSRMAKAFGERATGRPLMLALDDLHWATSLDLEFLSYLLRGLGDRRIFVVGTARTISDEDAARSEFARWVSGLGGQRALATVRLEPFDGDRVRQWMEASFDRIAIRPQDLRRLRQATGGNPYYLSEVVRHLIDEGKLRREGVAWACAPLDDVELPETVHSVVKSKLGGVGDELRKVLEVACVIGEEFRFETLQLATELGEDALEELLERAVRRHVLSEHNLSPGSDYRFDSPTLRSVLYASMSARKRKRAHRRVVHALDQLYGGDAARIAKVLCYHHHAVGDWEHALAWGLMAAEQTLARQDNDSAEDSLRRARRAATELAAAGTPASAVQAGRLDHSTGTLYVRLGRLDEAEALLRRAVRAGRDADDAELRLDALLDLADCRLSRGDREYGLEAGRLAIEAAGELGDWRREATARIHVARCAAPMGRYDEAVEALDPVTGRISVADAVEASLRSLALRELSWIHAKRGAFDDAEMVANEALEVARGSGDALAEYAAVSVLGLVHGERGDMQASIPHLERALELARKLSRRRREAIELLNLGECNYVIGRHAVALSHLEDALHIVLEIRDRATEGSCRVNLGRVLRARGEREQAAAMLDQGRELCREGGRTEYEGLAELELAELRLEDGDAERAAAQTEHAHELLTKLGSFHLWRAERGLSRLAEARDDRANALAHARRAAELLDRHRAALPTAAAERLAADATGLAEALERLGG